MLGPFPASGQWTRNLPEGDGTDDCLESGQQATYPGCLSNVLAAVLQWIDCPSLRCAAISIACPEPGLSLTPVVLRSTRAPLPTCHTPGLQVQLPSHASIIHGEAARNGGWNLNAPLPQRRACSAPICQQPPPSPTSLRAFHRPILRHHHHHHHHHPRTSTTTAAASATRPRLPTRVRGPDCSFSLLHLSSRFLPIRISSRRSLQALCPSFITVLPSSSPVVVVVA